jgi:hypothetical protein
MARRATKRKISDSTGPIGETPENTVTEPVQPEEPQEEVEGRDNTEAENAFGADSTPATPVESAHTTSSPAPRRQQDDEDEPDLDYEEGSDEGSIRYERSRERSLSEDRAEADAYFTQYVTPTFHPDDKMADDRIRVIYPLVTQPPTAITIPPTNWPVQERQSATKVRDHRRALHKARFWPLYAMSYHKAVKAS